MTYFLRKCILLTSHEYILLYDNLDHNSSVPSVNILSMERIYEYSNTQFKNRKWCAGIWIRNFIRDACRRKFLICQQITNKTEIFGRKEEISWLVNFLHEEKITFWSAFQASSVMKSLVGLPLPVSKNAELLAWWNLDCVLYKSQQTV